jgi:hypothetical protein
MWLSSVLCRPSATRSAEDCCMCVILTYSLNQADSIEGESEKCACKGPLLGP